MSAPEAESLRARSQAPRPSVWRGQGPVVAVVALGGAIGAVARYAASLWWPAQAAVSRGRPSGSTSSGAP
jgi:CrcB protein